MTLTKKERDQLLRFAGMLHEGNLEALPLAHKWLHASRTEPSFNRKLHGLRSLADMVVI